MSNPRYFMQFPKGIQREEKPFAGGVGEAWSSIGDEEKPAEEPSEDPPVSNSDAPNVDDPAPTSEAPKAEDPKPADPPTDAPPEKIKLTPEMETSITEEVKKSNPNASEEELKNLTESAKASALEDHKDNLELQGMYKEKIDALKADDANKDLTDEELQAKAKELIDDELLNANPFSRMNLDSLSEDGPTTELDWTKASKGIYVNGKALNVEENSIDALNTAIDNRINEIKSENENYEKLDDEAKRVAQFVSKNGIHKLNEYVHPDKKIEGLIGLPSDNKVAIFLKQNNPDATEEDLQNEISEMKENIINTETGLSEYEVKLGQIDRGLRTELRTAQEAVLQRNEKAFQDREAEENKTNETLINSVHAEIDKLDKMGGDTIPKEIKDALKGSFNATELKRLQSNPMNLAKSILYDKFADEYVKGLRDQYFKLGKNKGFTTSANIPIQDDKQSVNTPPVDRSASAPDQQEGGFKGWGKSLETLQSQ